ncbi:hypothetical protein Tco_1434998 [Tanacetum coccineum]
MESSDQFICFFCGSLSDEYGCPCFTCELCGNDAHYGYDCPSQVPFVYNQDPCFNQNLDNFPKLHQEISTEILLAKEKPIKAIRTCLKNNNQPPEEKSIAVLLAEESILTAMQTLEENQIDTESMQELLLQFSKDLPTLEGIDETSPSDAITSDLPITDSLVMEDEHLDTIPETDSDEEIESSVKNLNLTPSESEDLSDYINPLYNEVLEDIDSIPPGNDHFNAESDLIESLLNKDTVITFPKIDFLLEELAGELALINPIPSGIADTNFDPKEDIRLIKKLLYDNSSPRPPEELNSEISDAMIESFSSSLIPVKDSDSLMVEIDIFLAADDSIPPGIDSDGYDSEEDNPFLEYEPDPGKLTIVVVEDIFGEPRVHMPNILPTHPTLCQDLDFTLSTDFSGSGLVVSFPSRNRNNTFDPRISIKVQSKIFLSRNKFSISFISDPLSPVLETFLPFSSEIKDKV